MPGARRIRLLVLGAGLASSGCDARPHTADDSSGATHQRAGLSREQALDSARAFIARSEMARLVFLDSAEVIGVDSLWRVTFRRRAVVAPNVVTVDVHARTGAMRFPGDE